MTTAVSASLSRNVSTGRASVSRITSTEMSSTGLRSSFLSDGGIDHLHDEVVPAIQGNHLAIQALLHRTLHRPSPAQFASSTMRPEYRADERLIIKQPTDRRVVAHIHAQPQEIHFGRSSIPILRLRDLALTAEYAHRGFAQRILATTESRGKQSGAMLLLARGESFQQLPKLGWATLGNCPISIVSPQRLLGALPEPLMPESPFYANSMPKQEVRIGRLTDLESIQRLYDHPLGNRYGAVVRNGDDYWSWLATRRAHDRIFIFVEDGHPLSYVVVRGASVIELVDTTEDYRGAARLLGRVGLDAIEQGRHSLKIHAPITDRAHLWSDQAGGQTFFGEDKNAWMAKVISFRQLLRRIATILNQRYHRKLPCEVGIRIGSEDLLIRTGVKSLRITRGTSARHQLVTTTQAATQMILGYRNAEEVLAAKQLVANSDKAMDAALALFPAFTFWHTCWDDVPVMDA